MISRFADAGLLRLVKPARFGGYEYGPSALVRVGFEVGRACGSTAWCVMLGNINSWFTSYWPLSAQEDVWGQGIGNLIAGAVTPTGTSETAEGGFTISGRWPFTSNCDNSQWFFVSCMMPEKKGMGWFLVPADALKIDQNSWRVSGLQGSGSKTLIAEKPVFVPSHRVIDFGAIMAGSPPGAEIADNVMAKFAFPTFGGVALVTPLLGMAQGALDWFIDAMPKKALAPSRPGAPPAGSESPFIQERAGRASACIEAAKTSLLASVEEAESVVMAGGILSVEQRVGVRRSIAYAANQSVEAVNLLFEAAGASAADLDVPIQRFWRDINAGARHVSLDNLAVNSMTGQFLFGMKPNGTH